MHSYGERSIRGIGRRNSGGSGASVHRCCGRSGRCHGGRLV